MGRKHSDKTKRRIRIAAIRSWRSGTRRKRRTRRQVIEDKIVRPELDEQRRAEYQEHRDRARVENAHRDQNDENARLYKLPKGVIALGHGPVTPPFVPFRSECDNSGRVIRWV
jgi:hypothetical protein